MVYKLRSLQNPAWEIQIGASPVRVGRSKENHLKLTDPAASRHHAEISLEGGAPVVVDLNSARGTFVNNMRVQKSPLKAGDVVAFGPEQFQCVVAEAASAPAPARPAAPAAPPRAKKPSFTWVWVLGGVVILAVVGVVILMAGPLKPAVPVPTETNTIAPTYTSLPTYTSVPTNTTVPTNTSLPTSVLLTPTNTIVPNVIMALKDIPSAVFKIETEGRWYFPPYEDQQKSTGSGFVIDETGVAVTNNHVITGASYIKIYFEGDTTPMTAEVLGTSECSDLAVIKLSGVRTYNYLRWYEGEASKGLDVIAFGWPLDAENVNLTKGIISESKTRFATSWSSVNSVVETDAKLNPGNSGGPLIEVSTASIVGVNYATRAGVDQNFAITVQEALPLIQKMKAGEYVWSLGIYGEAYRQVDFPLLPMNGIVVWAVKSGGPADKAGVKGGDLLYELEGLRLADDGTMQGYCDVLRSRSQTDTLTIKVLRYNPNTLYWYRYEGQINGRELQPVP